MYIYTLDGFSYTYVYIHVYMSRVYVDNVNFYIDCLYICIDTNSTKFKREISLRRLSCIFRTVGLHNARSSVTTKNEEIKLAKDDLILDKSLL